MNNRLSRSSMTALYAWSLDERNKMMMNTAQRIAASLTLAATAASTIAAPAEARTHHSRHHYYGRTYYGRTSYYRYCRHSSGETGLIAGGVGGALLGNSVVGHGVLGTALGAVGGALAGRAIDRTITAPQRCYYG